ncbi:hypothetical protein POM88_018590 [Heracleum sosnowskyi]|uniref:Uncharacterized protein n=1 Tax=Heracleum sosnowskyi TaxID=360622 RepID=A0AAD8IQU3_9APIA|nr:hypothetical protein POM88_018590 [Heracleum sosnowskyi]
MDVTTIFLFCSILSSILIKSIEQDTIRSNQTMRDGRQTVIDGDTITSAGVVNMKGITLHTIDAIIWSRNTSVSIKNPVAQLFKSGNPVLRDDHNIDNPEDYI